MAILCRTDTHSESHDSSPFCFRNLELVRYPGNASGESHTPAQWPFGRRSSLQRGPLFKPQSWFRFSRRTKPFPLHPSHRATRNRLGIRPLTNLIRAFILSWIAAKQGMDAISNGMILPVTVHRCHTIEHHGSRSLLKPNYQAPPSKPGQRSQHFTSGHFVLPFITFGLSCLLFGGFLLRCGIDREKPG